MLNSYDFWTPAYHRNATKLQRFLSRGSKIVGKISVADYVDIIIALGRVRSMFAPKHVYIVNAGSSGSHWIEAMLGMMPGFYGGGEIYLPSKLLDYFSSISINEANIALDTIYLAHVGCVHKDSLCAFVGNTAHLANHYKMSNFSINKKILLLLRNPLDVVISRTFRKDEYKEYIASGLSDRQYLKQNCIYVENFYKNLDFESFDMVIRYENFLESPRVNLEKIIELIDLSVSEADIERAIVMTSIDSAKRNVDNGKKAITNIYLGNKKEYNWAKDYVCERLGDIISKLGYV